MSRAKLQLTRDHIIKMLEDPSFYAMVPEYEFLHDSVRDAQAYLASVAGCIRCKHKWNAMRGCCDAFFLKLWDLRETNHDAITRIKQWLSEKKGYPVDRCVLYYRRSRSQGRIAKFEF